MSEFIVRAEETDLFFLFKDFKELIRCKDCKFSMSGIDKYNEQYILCQLHERSYGVTDDGFCSWAEREEEKEK